MWLERLTEEWSHGSDAVTVGAGETEGGAEVRDRVAVGAGGAEGADGGRALDGVVGTGLGVGLGVRECVRLGAGVEPPPSAGPPPDNVCSGRTTR